MTIHIRDLGNEMTIYYICPHCKEASGITINKEPIESSRTQELFRCEHCGNISEIWILPCREASRIRRLLKENSLI